MNYNDSTLKQLQLEYYHMCLEPRLEDIPDILSNYKFSHTIVINPIVKKDRDLFMYLCTLGNLKTIEYLLENHFEQVKNSVAAGFYWSASFKKLNVVKFLFDEILVVKENVINYMAQVESKTNNAVLNILNNKETFNKLSHELSIKNQTDIMVKL